MINGVTNTSAYDQNEMIRGVQNIEQLKAISFLLGIISAIDNKYKDYCSRLQLSLQDRSSELYLKYQDVKTGGNIVNPTLVDWSKMKIQENFESIPNLKLSIINALSHSEMNIPTANSLGNKLASSFVNLEKANIQYNKSYVAKYSNRTHKNQYDKFISNTMQAIESILQDVRLFKAIVPSSVLESSRSVS